MTRNTNSIQITWLQFVFLIHGCQVGVGFLTLPRELAQTVGTDGWISILFGWALSIIASLFIIYALQKHPGATLLDLFRLYLGKWLGNAASILLLIYFAGGGIAIMFSIITILRTWLLPNTPNFMLVLLLSIPTYMIIKHGLTMIGRYAEIIFYFSLWIILLLAFPINQSHWLYLLPIIKEGWLPILKATNITLLSFLGFETSFFLYPFLMNKKKAAAGVIVANTLTMLFYVITTMVCFAYFSSLEILQYKWPTLSLLKVIRVQFLDRWDVIFLSMYMIVISVTWIVYMALTVYGVKHLLPKSKPSMTTGLILLLACVLSIILTLSQKQVDHMLDSLNYVGRIIAYVLPVCLWIYAKIYAGIRQSHGGDSA